jgi:hypothetical protein
LTLQAIFAALLLTTFLTQDETVKYKAALRTMDIFGKHHSVQHDIITGQPLVANYIMPSRPVNP